MPPFPLLQESPNVSALGAPEDRSSSRELPQARQPHKCPAHLGSLALRPHFTGRRAAAHHGPGTDCAKGPCGPPTVQALPLLALPSTVPEASFYPPRGPHSTSQTSESWKRGLSHNSGPHSANRGQESRHFGGIWALQHYCITHQHKQAASGCSHCHHVLPSLPATVHLSVSKLQITQKPYKASCVGRPGPLGTVCETITLPGPGKERPTLPQAYP